jgi:hypothetical protein
LNAITSSGVDSRVANGDVLISFTEALAGNDVTVLDAARASLEARMGRDAVVAVSLIVANFSMVDRIANGLGIPVESMVLEPSSDFREALGINDFLSARNSLGPAP